MMEFIAGTTEQCLRHYFENTPQAEERLSQATGANGKTVHGWRERLPMGGYMLRVRYVLAVLGYEVEEVKRTPETLRAMGKAVALQVFDLAIAARQIGYTGTKPSDLLLHALLQRGGGRTNVSSDKERMIEQMLESKQAEIARAVDSLRKEFGLPPITGQADGAQAAPPPPAPATPSSPRLSAPPSEDLVDSLERIHDLVDELAGELETVMAAPGGKRLLRLVIDNGKLAALSGLLSD